MNSTKCLNWLRWLHQLLICKDTKYVTVLDPDVKEKLKQAANGQYKVFSSSAVLLVLGDKQAYQQAADIYEGLKMLGY